ncbi:MAG: PilW family protein [Desulfomonilia bacterium]
MSKGVSLVELLLAITASSVLILALYSLNSVTEKSHREIRDSWYCTQSLRSAIVELNRDLIQCGYLLPEDLRVAFTPHNLFIAGPPRTSQHPGLHLSDSLAPPYFSIVRAVDTHSMTLDAIDIDHDTIPDYWADLGIITDSGPYVISHTYSRGDCVLRLTTEAEPGLDFRVVPAVHYELRPDGLYRNAQLLAEAIVGFEALLETGKLTVSMRASHNGIHKEITITQPIR